MFKKFFKRTVKIVKYPDPMSEKEVQNTFREQGADNKFWQALDTVIDSNLLDAVNDVSDPDLSPSKAAHAAGRIDAIGQLKAKIEQYKQ